MEYQTQYHPCEKSETCEAEAIIEAIQQALNPDIFKEDITTNIFNDSKFL